MLIVLTGYGLAGYARGKYCRVAGKNGTDSVIDPCQLVAAPVVVFPIEIKHPLAAISNEAAA